MSTSAKIKYDVNKVEIITEMGKAPDLPITVTAVYSDGSEREVSVTWDAIDASKYESPGSFIVEGTVEGTEIRAKATVIVVVETEEPDEGKPGQEEPDEGEPEQEEPNDGELGQEDPDEDESVNKEPDEDEPGEVREIEDDDEQPDKKDETGKGDKLVQTGSWFDIRIFLVLGFVLFVSGIVILLMCKRRQNIA